TPLQLGGTALLLTAQHVLDLITFAETLHEVTFIHAVPGLMRPIVTFLRENGLENRYANLKTIFVGGDLIPPDLVRDIRTVFPSARLYLGYGPTEGTIICTTYHVPPDKPVQA